MRKSIWMMGAGALALMIYAPTLYAQECRDASDAPLVKLLQPPPCENCEETKAELDELASLESTRTPEQARHALDDASRKLARFLEGGGFAFDPVKLAACENFFVKRRQDEIAAVEAAKATFCRTRPFLTPGNELHPLDGGAKPELSFSYPSGHSTYAATTGFLLAEMLPEKRAEIYGRINDYAHAAWWPACISAAMWRRENFTARRLARRF